jgi:hypothetical protein
VSTIRFLHVRALTVRADLEPGDHCRLLIAGPLIYKPATPGERKVQTDLAMKVAYWSEPNPTCPNCGGDV